MKDNNCLTLGTAQLGMDYGISNYHGKPGLSAAQSLVECAYKNGVRYFDTAQAYGNSEKILGDSLINAGINSKVKVVSKIDPSVDITDFDAVKACVVASLNRLQVDRLWGLMLHREEQLNFWDSGVKETFCCLREAGFVTHFGASIYTPQMALHALELNEFDIIQVPASLFDRRLARLGFFEQAAIHGVTVFVRSVFLQGLALMSSTRVKAVLPFAVPAVERLEDFCAKHDLNRHQFALRYAIAINPNAKVIVGAETADQIELNCKVAQLGPLDSEISNQWDEIWPDDREKLINPSMWPT